MAALRFVPLVLVVAGCSDSHAVATFDAAGSPDAGSTLPDASRDAGVERVSFAEFRARSDDAWCRITTACHMFDRELYLHLRELPDAQCSDLVDFGGPVRELREDRLAFDEVAAAACLRELERGIECFAEPFEICAAVYHGIVPNGAACDYSDECASERCVYDPETCTASCAAQLPDGAGCDFHEDCESGWCPDGRCIPHEVSYAAEGESCGDSVWCAESLYCEEDPSGRTCFDPPALGEECDPSEYPLCDPPYVCEDREGTARCVEPPPVRSAAGERCGPDALCNPLLGLECVDGACASMGDGSEGSRCGVDAGRGHCDAGLVCHRGYCRAPIAFGSPCAEHDGPCAGGAYCRAGVCDDLGDCE